MCGGSKPSRCRGGPRTQTQTQPSPRTRTFVPHVTCTTQAGDIPLHSRGAPASFQSSEPLGLSGLQQGVGSGHREWSKKHHQDALEVQARFCSSPRCRCSLRVRSLSRTMPSDDTGRADVAAWGVKGRGVNFPPFCTVSVFNLKPAQRAER